MIGLSLSFCVNDILRGRVREDDVRIIIAGTNIRRDDPKHFEDVIDSYAQNYWYVNPEEGKAIARRLWRGGKVFQAREFRGEAPCLAMQHWLRLTTQPSLQFGEVT